MKWVLPQINFIEVLRTMSVPYTAVLDVSEDSVRFLSALLHAERVRRGTRKGRRVLGTYQQAILVLRWFLDDTRMSALARDNAIAVSTAYNYRDEGIAVLAARRPSLHGALLAAKTAGHSHVIVDGTLIHTDRISTPGPTAGVDLWWSGKHHHHGGNVQVVSAPDGWPLWTSDVRPGREHDLSAARTDPALLGRVTDWVSDGALALADLGCEGEPETFTIPFKKPKDGQLTIDEQSCNAVHGALRCLGERANSLLKTTYKALRRHRGCPWRIGDIVAAALVLLHHEHGRTT
jgi:DDE superfamily endonuclease